jgi:Uma2 family endonuclease
MGPAVEASGIPVADYLEGERVAQVKHEYVNGQVFAMVGVSRAHNTIALNLAVALRQHLKGGPCHVYLSDVKLHVGQGLDERFYYPDLFVDCRPGQGDRYFSDTPKLVVEVLSASTERTDRAEKLDAYRSLASLEEYLLLSQDRKRAELYRRATGWVHETFTGDADLRLDSVDLALTLDEIYEAVTLGPEV